MSGQPASAEGPIRVAIVGAGPSGFYAAGALLKADAGREIDVDLYDRLPVPFGLVRFGVAPDHPKIKTVTRVFEKTAAHPRFRFLGNVHIGRDVSREDLRDHYHAVIYAVGAETDRRLGVPGEDLRGSHPATEFVAWYNGHPEHHDRSFPLHASRVAVIGNGNVAIDCARMLALHRDELRVTDTADHAIAAFETAEVDEVLLIGRRGPAQAAFTNPELLELGELADADVIVDPADLELDPLSAAWLESDAADMTARRNVEILREYASRAPQGRRVRIVFRFCRSPVEIVGREEGVEALVLERNELVDDGGRIAARPTGERETIEVNMVLRSVGYRGIPLPGVPFDEERGVIPNERGRVTSGGAAVPGEYVVGWIKRGPSGVIGTNKKDAQETVAAVLEDIAAGAIHQPAMPGPEDVVARVRAAGADIVMWEDWQAIDAHEAALGEPHGRPRVKLRTVEELLDARGRAPGA